MSKRNQRLAAKMRKAEAFLAVAELNDKQGRTRSSSKEPVELKEKKPFLTGDAVEDLKQRLKERKKLLKTIPHFDLKMVGSNASLELPTNMRTPLYIKDLQQLLLQAMLGAKAPVEPIRWCRFLNWSRLANVTCLLVDGVGCEDFVSQQTDWKSPFHFKLEFVAPPSYGSSTVDELWVLPLSTNQKYMLKKQYGDVDAACAQGHAFKVYQSLFNLKKKAEQNNSSKKASTKVTDGDDAVPLQLQLMLSLSQLIEENYPLPLPGLMKQKYSDYVATKEEYAKVTADSPLYSVDCEMCLTNVGKMELTRICVVNSDLEVVYDSFVRPHNPISNYLTRYSGITAEMLTDVTTRLADVQQALKNLLPPDAILVGQSLNCDLNALQMMHPYVIDTSVIYNITGIRRRKSKLSVLSKVFLGQEIQKSDNSTKGHNPEEDAMAAMKLVKLKLEKGYAFGDILLGGTVHQNKTEPEDVTIVSTGLYNAVSKYDKKVSVIGVEPLLQNYKKFSSNNTDEEEETKKVEGEPCFVETATSNEAISQTLARSYENNLTMCHISANNVGLKDVVKWAQELWEKTVQNGMFIMIWAGSKDQNAFVGIALNKAEHA